MKISTNRQKKEAIVNELSEKIGKTKAIVFANYEGMTHKQIEELKKALKKADSELVVTKNSLLKLALKQSKKENLSEDVFQNPTATLFAYSDIALPLKELARIIKSLKLPEIKLGIFDNQALTSDQVLKLATLPSREVLIAQVVTGMKAPIFGLHRALNWNITNLILTLKAIEVKKATS